MGEADGISRHFSLRTLKFFMHFVGMWPPNTRSEKYLSDALLFCIFVTVAAGLIIEGTDFVFSWGDIKALSYNAPTTVTVIIEFIKLTTFIINRSEVMSFNNYTEKTFWKGQYSTAEFQILKHCNRRSMRVVVSHIFLMECVVWLYLAIPVVESIGRNATDRMLPFNMYVDLPFTTSPLYEITFIFQSLAAMGVGICTTSFAGFLCTTNLYTATQFKILGRRILLSCDKYNLKSTKTDKLSAEVTSTYAILRNCIKRHQDLLIYMDRVENLFNTLMLAQTLGSVLEMCFCGFQIVLGGKSSILRTALSVVFLVAANVQLLLFAWSSHEIIIESLDIAEAAYQATWYGLPNINEGRTFRQCLLVIIARARKPVILTVGKFTPMSLDTFTSVFNTAISYFTILRQMNEED